MTGATEEEEGGARTPHYTGTGMWGKTSLNRLTFKSFEEASGKTQRACHGAQC